LLLNGSRLARRFASLGRDDSLDVAHDMDPDHVQELFSAFGPVSIRRMFGGAGVFADGLMIAIVADGAIYLKAAPDSTDAFERERCGPFSYATRDGTRQLTSYWQMPDRLYDDPGELAQWARRSLAVARAKQAGKTKPGRKAAAPARKAQAKKRRR
jgi:DNA transformation protein